MIVDDDLEMCRFLEELLQKRGFQPESFTSPQRALLELEVSDFDVVLTDWNMPDLGGVELCRAIVQKREDVPIVVLTAFGSLDTAIASIRAGAYDFVTKPVDEEFLVVSLKRAADHHDLHVKIKLLDQHIEASETWNNLIGENPVMLELKRQLTRIAPMDASVLIVGESGTGKELVARALHDRSTRSGGPFVAVNCASLPGNLLESELFGHRKGALTDTGNDRRGSFLQAQAGSIFLDEIGELPLDLQPKLLRVLEQGTVRAVGSDEETEIDVRVLSATNRDLETAVDAGLFREDLYYRINVVELQVPPLRSRGADILLLAQRFLQECARRGNHEVAGISAAAARRLLDYPWPGNVRELRNAIERAVALTRVDRLIVEDLPERLREHHSGEFLVGSDNPSELATLESIEKRYILHVLEAVNGNRTLSARILGLDRKTLYRKLRQYRAQ